jgi:phage gp36-like protein
MSFATRADLLARSNARRLAQLAVPADRDMVPHDALRAVIAGGDLAAYSADDQASLTLALDAIDKALNDADALILSYGIPATVQTTLLARLASTIALYYLQNTEKLDKAEVSTYDAAIATLKSHARGDLNLIPASPTDPVIEGDVISISSNQQRYGANASVSGGDW